MFTTYLELAVSIFATPLVVVFLYTLITSALHRSCKVFLIMNGLGLLLLSTSHISVAVYRLMKPGAWRAQDIVANVPLFLHQLAYGTCTVSMLLITIERTIIGLNPRLYVEKRTHQWGMIAVCVLSEVRRGNSFLKISLFWVCIALPCIMLVQDGPIINGQKLYTTSEMKQQIACLICTLLDALAVVMAIIAFACSSQRYNHAFSKSTLGTRYQMKEVISLTRVLIPVCCSSLFFRFTVIILAYFAFTDEKVLDIFFTIIRFCCTAAAIIEPTLLLTRHRMLRKRLRLLFGIPEGDVMPQIERDPTAISNVYFDAFNSDLNAKRR